MAKNKEELIQHLLTRGVENIYPTREFLEKQLKSGKKLTIYQGVDPTGPDLHIGHSIPVRKLAEFQKLGHKVILLIGDFTAQIGDPTDKSTARKRLTHAQVMANAKGYKKQLGKILDFTGKNPAQLKYNSKWLAKMTFADVVELASNFTVQQIIVRDMFDERIKEGKPVYLHEFLYPLMQGYDSVAMNVDGELGGNDQTFNMLAGRDLMKALKNKEKFVLTTKMLNDPAGKKMGKTEGNMARLSDSPADMFGKIMSWNDEMVLPAFDILTEITEGGIEIFAKALDKGENPRNIKFKLAEEVVKMFHGQEKADKAGEAFNKQFRDHEKPTKMEEKKVSQKMMNIVDLVFTLGLASSKSEARRLVEQGGVRIDDSKITDVKEVLGIHDEMIVQVGKRKFVKIKQ